MVVVWLRRHCRAAGRPRAAIWTPRFSLPRFRAFDIITRDGIQLNVRVSLPSSQARLDGGKGNTPVKDRKVMLLAAPLGQCGPAIYNPIMSWFGDEYGRCVAATVANAWLGTEVEGAGNSHVVMNRADLT